jgi:hypothetical protein
VARVDRYQYVAGLAVVVLALTTALGCSEEPGQRQGDAAIADTLHDALIKEGGPTHELGAHDGPADAATPDAATPDAATPDGPSTSYNCNKPHPAWLLCDDFEGLAQGVDAWFSASKWTESIGKGNAGRLTSTQQAHGGSYALDMPAAASAGYQGADLMWRACSGVNKAGCKPLLGYPQLYLRAFVKFAADHKKVHHFLSIGGGPTDDYWAPYGNAGCRPNGARSMGTTVDFKDNSHETFFYTYSPDMKCDSQTNCAKYANPQQICDGCATKGMPCTNGLECCWGNHFAPSPAVALPLGKWFCFEMMMKQNDLGKANGEMAYWIDDTLAHEVKTMEWRKDAKLQLNMVRLQHYLTTSDAAGHSNRVSFDDVVISTERVGCK